MLNVKEKKRSTSQEAVWSRNEQEQVDGSFAKVEVLRQLFFFNFHSSKIWNHHTVNEHLLSADMTHRSLDKHPN